MSEKEQDIKIHDSRLALLQHYSSKSSNQAIIILSLALVFFTCIQSMQFLEALHLEPVIMAFLASLFALSVRALGRLIYWGKLAKAICQVDPLDKELASKDQNNEEGKYLEGLKRKGVGLVPTYLYRLEEACQTYATIVLDSGKINWLYKLTCTWKRFFAFLLFCVVVSFIPYYYNLILEALKWLNSMSGAKSSHF
jgi:hypothetical protein